MNSGDKYTKRDVLNSEQTVEDTLISSGVQEDVRSDDKVIESGPPKWYLYGTFKGDGYFKRKFLGGNESAFSLVFGFIADCFHVKGTVFIRCFFPALFAVIVSVLLRLFTPQVSRTMLPNEFYLVFSISCMISLVIRLFWSWRKYQQGHEKVLEIATSLIDCMLLVSTSPHIRSRGMEVIELMRKMLILHAFVRHDLREARQHILDTTPYMSGWRKKRLAVEAFTSGSREYIEDPHGAPPLKLLLNEEEVEHLSEYSTHDRVIVAAASVRIYLNKYVNVGTDRVVPSDGQMFLETLSKVIHDWNHCRAIIRVPTPFVLHHLISVLLFLQVCIVAPVYFCWGQSGWVCVMFAAVNAIGFYGLEEAAKEMEVPFGWRQSDCSLTKSCRNVLKRAITLCKVTKVITE